MLANQRDGLVGGAHTTRNRYVLRVRQTEIGLQQVLPGPVNEFGSHLADEDQRGIVDVFHLQQLPDQHEFEHRTDSARSNDIGV